MNTSEINCNISCRPIFSSSWTFFAVKLNGSDVNQGICFIVKTRSYRHTENISLGSEPKKFSYSRLVCILKHPGVMRQIPGVKSLPSTSKAKKSTKITFSADKIYYINVVEYPKIINM